MRQAVVAGLGLVALMQLVFLLTAGDRPTPYAEVQALSLVATLAAAYGASRLGERPGMTIMAAGLGVNALMRVVQFVFGLSRLPMLVGLAFLAGFALASFLCATWSSAPEAQARRLRFAFWLLALAHFVAMLVALSRFNAALGLALGAAGFALAAPNVRVETSARA